MGNIRDTFAKSEPSSEIVPVTLVVDEIPVTIEVEVREQSVDQQYAILDKVRDANGDFDQKRLSIEGVLATAYEPGTDDKAFDDADRDMLGTKSSNAFQALFKATSRAAGLGDEDEAIADLDEGPTDEPSSS